MLRIAALLILALPAGCPPQEPVSPINDGPVKARIAINVKSGESPLTVAVSAASSTSDNGGPLTFAWDFDDGSTSTEVSVTHVYTRPGLYELSLTATDSTGAIGRAAVDVRVRGADPTAVIKTDVNGGRAPLTVQFDGTASTSPDDRIRDYFWNFGDGETSNKPQPLHVYRRQGSFTVTLRVVTRGGAEHTAVTTIEVGGSAASLQFNGSQLAVLPIDLDAPLPAITLEAWFRADPIGGRIAEFVGSDLAIDILPATSRVIVTSGDATVTGTVANLSGSWRHLAVSFDSAGTTVIYIDGVATGQGTGGDPINAGSITLGKTYGGKISEVRLWNAARTAASIQATLNRRLTGSEAGLAGYWPISAGGSQQHLEDLSLQNVFGSRGMTVSDEEIDPPWTNDAPPL